MDDLQLKSSIKLLHSAVEVIAAPKLLRFNPSSIETSFGIRYPAAKSLHYV